MRHVTTAMLTDENRDASVGCCCVNPDCGYMLHRGRNRWIDWPPIAVVEAPWISHGLGDDSKWAIIKECPQCFTLCWFHGTDQIKRYAECRIPKADGD